MKKSLYAASAVAVVAMMGMSPAMADTSAGWYTGVGVGATFTPDSSARVPGNNTETSFDTGLNGLVSGGYAWDNGLRLEGEVGYSSAGVDKAGSASGHGKLNNTNLFMNALYDINLGMMMTPYIGAGLGVQYVEADNIGNLAAGGSLDESGVAKFAYQGIAGVAAQLDHNWAVTADYRYIESEDPRFDRTTGGNGRMDNTSHNVVVGLRYTFGDAPVMAKSVAPAMKVKGAKAPAAAEVAQSYMVFFDFDKSVLTEEAKNILTSAAKDYESGKYVRIVVTGHTDTVGSAQYNKGLSGRRAAAVKKFMAEQGVKAEVVKTVGAGKGSLLVPTADGVREAQNRRAEIVFKTK